MNILAKKSIVKILVYNALLFAIKLWHVLVLIVHAQ